MAKKTKISVGIVTYNSSADIAKCISTLTRFTPKSYDLDIYVFDNLSPDSEVTRKIVAEEFPAVTLIPSSKNNGFGHGHNKIIDLIDSDYHLILNADIEFVEDVLSSLVGYLDDHRDVALVTPEIRNIDDTIQHLPKEFPKFRYVLSSTIPAFAKYRDDYTRAKSAIEEPEEMDISTGCFMLVRTNQLKEVGGFDDDYFLYFEDFDLSLRLRQFGKLIYYPGVCVKHLWHRDSKKSRKIFFIQIKSMLYFYSKWGLSNQKVQSKNSKQISKMHIVYVINNIKKSGPNEVLVNMVRGINKDLYKITVVSFSSTSDSKQVQLLQNAGACHINIGLERKRDIITKGAKLLRELFKNIKPDVIHSHTILSDIAVVRSRYYNVPFFTTIHNDIYADYTFLFGNLLGRLYRYWHIFYLRKFEYVVNCSKTAYKANMVALPNSIYVRNGINNTTISHFAARKVRSELGLSERDILYVFAGSLSRRKNVIELISRFNQSRCEDEHLIIMGKGELDDECAHIAGDYVHLLGFREDAQEVLAASDVYISFSLSEGFSISVIEALEKGLYLLLSDIPAHLEAFEIDTSVYIGEYFSSKTFVEKKNTLRSKISNPDKLVQFKNKYLSATAMMHEYEQHYKEAIHAQ